MENELYSYELEKDGTVTITCYHGNAAEVVIPSRINDYTVTRIGPHTFLGHKYLSKVTIPETVTHIESGTFNQKTKLEEAILPEGVLSIGKNAFYACHKLMRIHIPSSVTYIGDHCFDYCGKVVTGTQCRNDYESSDPWTRRNAGAYGPAVYDEDVVEFCMTAVVIHGSYAEQYCQKNNIRYVVK